MVLDTDHVIEQVNRVIILLRSSLVFRWFGSLREYWSPSNLRNYLDSYTLAECGECQGRTGLSPPAAIPSTVD